MSWAEGITATAAMLKALTWPAVVGLGLWWYRPSISSLLSRLTKGEIGANGAKVEALPSANQPTDNTQPSKIAEQAQQASSSAGGPPPSPLYDPQVMPLLGKIKENHPDDMEAQLGWMTRLFAIAATDRLHEETYRLIFQSQLLFVYRLNASGGAAPFFLAESIFTVAVTDWPEIHKDRSVGEWLQFLIARQIVEKQDGAEEVRITLMGRDFLRYVVERQLPEKPQG